MSTYATLEDLDDDFPNIATRYPDDAERQKLLDEAEDDVDMSLGVYPPDASTGLKLNPAVLLGYQKIALKKAVFAQVEYRLVKGPAFFIESRPENQSGPEGSREGKEPYLGPKARMQITRAHLFRLTSSNSRGRAQQIFIPNQNVDDNVE